MIAADLLGVDGKPYSEAFLIDSGADRTIVSLETLTKLGIAGYTPQDHPGFTGIGGSPAFQFFRTTIVLTATDKRLFKFDGEFVVFTDDGSTPIGLLGRDILDQFDVILSRRRNEVLLLNDSDCYSVSSA